MPGAELWILGDGPERGALAEQVARHSLESRVRIIGQVAAAEIPAWLQQADAGILPIRSDVFLEFAFPNKLGEFIIMGLPVIVSRLRAIRCSFTDEALAFATPNDPADLARQMIRLSRDQRLQRDLAVRARLELRPDSMGRHERALLACDRGVVGATGPFARRVRRRPDGWSSEAGRMRIPRPRPALGARGNPKAS